MLLPILAQKFMRLSVPDPTAMIADWFPLCGVETAVAHEATYPSRKSEYGPGLAGLIELGLQQSGTDYQKIVLRREAFKGLVRALFEKIDLLAVPAQTFAAPSIDNNGDARRKSGADHRSAALQLPL